MIFVGRRKENKKYHCVQAWAKMISLIDKGCWVHVCQLRNGSEIIIQLRVLEWSWKMFENQGSSGAFLFQRGDLLLLLKELRAQKLKLNIHSACKRLAVVIERGQGRQNCR